MARNLYYVSVIRREHLAVRIGAAIEPRRTQVTDLDHIVPLTWRAGQRCENKETSRCVELLAGQRDGRSNFRPSSVQKTKREDNDVTGTRDYRRVRHLCHLATGRLAADY